MTTNERNQIIALATANMDQLVEDYGYRAIATNNGSMETLIVAIWHPGSSEHGEADEYVEVI